MISINTVILIKKRKNKKKNDQTGIQATSTCMFVQMYDLIM